MREWIAAVLVLMACLAVMPWAVGAMRSPRRRSGSGMGGALLEMQAFIAPSTEHLIAAREDKVVESVGEPDPTDPESIDQGRKPSERAASDALPL